MSDFGCGKFGRRLYAPYYLLSEKTTHTRAHAPRERERESTHPDDERMEDEDEDEEEVVFFFVHRRRAVLDFKRGRAREKAFCVI